MRKNFDKKIDMDELAKRVFLSHSGLIWKFKKELNTTPSNYLKILRLRYAKQLLLNYSYSVTEISEMCGFANPYYFDCPQITTVLGKIGGGLGKKRNLNPR